MSSIEDSSAGRRPHLTLRIKLAAALLQVRDAEGKPFIDWEHAKQLSADQIISLFHFDHWPYRHEAGGATEPWNLQPRPIAEHRVKTAKVDVPEVAKIKRITRAEAAFRQRLLAKTGGEIVESPKRKKWPSRPFRRK